MSSNQTIIIEEGVKHGIFSETEAELMLIRGEDIKLHTVAGWYHLGKIPRQGEHGIRTKLWKHANDKVDEGRDKYILVTSYLFSEDQVEDITK